MGNGGGAGASKREARLEQRRARVAASEQAEQRQMGIFSTGCS